MSEEIKEILESLDKIAKGDYYPEDLLYYENCKILLDYITNLQQKYEIAQKDIESLTNNYNDLIKMSENKIDNLQQENEKLKKEFKPFKKLLSIAIDEVNCYQSRCEKAIEEINYWGIDKEHNDNSAMRLALGNILNILNGSDAK